MMTVSGADSADFRHRPANGCPPLCRWCIGPHMGIFEFATFEDSGTLDFTVAAFDDATTTVDACKTGQGVKTVAASTATTNTATLDRHDRPPSAACP